MLAPYCESEATEPVITRLGLRSLDLWDEQLRNSERSGTLVVAHRRDRTDFDRFAQRTAGHERIDAARLAELEPHLAGQFDRALFYRRRSTTSSRAKVLPQLHAAPERARRGHPLWRERREPATDGITIDCRGIAARDETPSCAASRAR